MQALAQNVTVIPARRRVGSQRTAAQVQKTRVAAYCRVSTDSEEQETSYETQVSHYTEYIKSKPEWQMVEVYADDGISGTNTSKRDEFNRMIADCEAGKIDLILTKSISRFSRNTLDCLKYTRKLKALNIAVFFEKENINTMDSKGEVLLTIMASLAQQESESLSANVRMGIQYRNQQGKVQINHNWFLGYTKDAEGNLVIDPEQAEIVRRIFREYLEGASFLQIKRSLEADGIPNGAGHLKWHESNIHQILTNEKYCGDVLLQKTFISDCISRKVVRNTGQLPMYLIENHHEAIIDRKTFDAVQAEMARRNAGRSPSKKTAPTGKSAYTSKYALSERLVCGECGTLYRRCTWAKRGRKRVVWRCVSRLDYGTKYCHDSPTLDEEPLQRAILAAINSAMSRKSALIRQITSAMELELAPIPGESMSLADIERRLEELNRQTRSLVAKAAHEEDASDHTAPLRAIMDEAAALKERRAVIEEQRKSNSQAVRRIEDAADALEQASAHITQWDEPLIRQLVDAVKVVSAEKTIVYLRGGIEIEQDMIKAR